IHVSYSFYFVSFFFSSRRRHTRFSRDWSSDVCSSDLMRQLQGVADAPLGKDPGMHHKMLVRIMGQGTMAQPVHQGVSIRRGKDVVVRVGLAGLAQAGHDAKQVKIVVAKHTDSIVAEGHDLSQGIQGVRATVDEITGKPETRPV